MDGVLGKNMQRPHTQTLNYIVVYSSLMYSLHVLMLQLGYTCTCTRKKGEHEKGSYPNEDTDSQYSEKYSETPTTRRSEADHEEKPNTLGYVNRSGCDPFQI